jgi:tRNA G10  N-methylase Trm11
MAENTAHPTQKPEKLIAKLILASSKQGDVVLDPFGGLGTTLIASVINGRNSISYEIDKYLCDFMLSRLTNTENMNKMVLDRLKAQELHIKSEKEKGKDKFYLNVNLDREVKTKQEQNIKMLYVDTIEVSDDVKVKYL